MTLQELHELIGKVLKEKPELAAFEVENTATQVIKGIGQYESDLRRKVVTLLDVESILLEFPTIEGGEWAWKAN